MQFYKCGLHYLPAPLLGKAHVSKYLGKTFYISTGFIVKISPLTIILFLFTILRKH